MVSGNTELRFVKYFEHYPSVRDKELELSERRAHAAKLSNRRRRESSGEKDTSVRSKSAVKKLNVEHVEHVDPDHTKVASRESKLPPGRARRHTSDRISMAYKGNSDPFQSRAVMVTANINRIVTFIRDVALPSLYFTPWLQKCALGNRGNPVLTAKSTVISSRAAARDWEQTMSNLDSEGAALACLAAFLCLLAKFTGASAQGLDSALSLRMRTTSSALLRDKLLCRSDVVDIDRPVLLHMFWLFRAEAFAGNLDAALVHGKIIWTLVHSGAAARVVDVGLLIHILFVDVDLAAKFMIRPLFDVDFCTKRLQPIWKMAHGILPPKVISEATDLRESIDFEPVREIMIADRLFQSLPNHPLPAEEVFDGSPSDIVFGFVASRTLVDNGRLLNYYIDLKESKLVEVVCLSEGLISTRAAITLALLYSIRSAGHVAWIQGVNIREASHLSMFHMHDMILKALVWSTKEELQHYRKARLWVLFLGALFVQQQMVSHRPIAGVERLRFTELLVSECKSAAVSTWSQMRALLEQFLYSQMWMPNGSVWFEKMLQKSERSSVDIAV